MHGVLWEVHSITYIQKFRTPKKIIINIDNKEVVRKLQEIQENQDIDFNTTQYETYLAILNHMKGSTIKIYFNWIISHKEIKTLSQKLNYEEHKIEKEICTQPNSIFCNEYIKSSSITFRLDNYQIQENPQYIIHIEMTRQKQIQYLLDKHFWSKEIFKTVNGEILRDAESILIFKN